MSITKEEELVGMQAASEAVAVTLREMVNYAKPGMTTKELDDFGGQILKNFSAIKPIKCGLIIGIAN